MRIRLSYLQVHEALSLSDGRIKEAAAHVKCCTVTFVRNAKRHGIDWRSYRKSLCSCSHKSPRCEGCKKQNRDSQMRATRARNNMMSCRRENVTEARAM